MNLIHLGTKAASIGKPSISEHRWGGHMFPIGFSCLPWGQGASSSSDAGFVGGSLATIPDSPQVKPRLGTSIGRAETRIPVLICQKLLSEPALSSLCQTKDASLWLFINYESISLKEIQLALQNTSPHALLYNSQVWM